MSDSGPAADRADLRRPGDHADPGGAGDRVPQEQQAHELKYRQNGSRPYWYCTCSVSVGGPGPGWVLYQTQPRSGGTPKPDLAGAERLHARHIEDTQQPEETYW